LWSWLGKAFPPLIPVPVCLFFLFITIPILLRVMAEQRPWLHLLTIGGISAFFALLGAHCLWTAYGFGQRLMIDDWSQEGRYIQIERGPLGCRFIVPVTPTSIESAVDFTCDISDLFEGERHQFLFENPDVAVRFADANTDRQWDPVSPGAQTARIARGILIAVVLLFLVYIFVKDFFPSLHFPW
jgi:hypothetical protein